MNSMRQMSNSFQWISRYWRYYLTITLLVTLFTEQSPDWMTCIIKATRTSCNEMSKESTKVKGEDWIMNTGLSLSCWEAKALKKKLQQQTMAQSDASLIHCTCMWIRWPTWEEECSAGQMKWGGGMAAPGQEWADWTQEEGETGSSSVHHCNSLSGCVALNYLTFSDLVCYCDSLFF